MKIEVYFDGSCYPNNPDRNTIGACVIKKNGETIAKLKSHQTHDEVSSNNYAEWRGLEIALHEIVKHEFLECYVYGDSQLVIKQMRGEYRIKAGKMYSDIAKRTHEFFKNNFTGRNVKFHWIPREQNQEADLLSKEVVF
jgi:ribonuclease HI